MGFLSGFSKVEFVENYGLKKIGINESDWYSMSISEDKI